MTDRVAKVTKRWTMQLGAITTAVKNLQFKSSVALAVLMVCIVGVGNYAYKRMGAIVILETQAGRCRDVASALSTAASEPLGLRDLAALNRLARGALADADLLFLAFTNTSGEVLAATSQVPAVFQQWSRTAENSVSSHTLAQPLFQPATNNAPAFLAFTFPVLLTQPGGGEPSGSQSELVGYIHLALGVSAVDEALARTNRNLLAIGLGLLVLVVPVSLLLVHWIVKPINQLLVVVRNYASGDMSARVPFKRSDEIGQLGLAFNNLADDLERSHNQLIKLNTELEDRVIQRTEQLKELASRDALTGLYNRRHFAETLSRTFAEAWRYGTDLSCIMIDVDNFKVVNDTYGHKMGDELLVAAATSILHQLRASDLAARYGGDEFVALLPRTSVVEARNLAERIREHFSRVVAQDLGGVNVALSMGIASLSTIASIKPDALVATADRALYEAKQRGKNCISMADPVPVV